MFCFRLIAHDPYAGTKYMSVEDVNSRMRQLQYYMEEIVDAIIASDAMIIGATLDSKCQVTIPRKAARQIAASKYLNLEYICLEPHVNQKMCRASAYKYQEEKMTFSLN